MNAAGALVHRVLPATSGLVAAGKSLTAAIVVVAVATLGFASGDAEQQRTNR